MSPTIRVRLLCEKTSATIQMQRELAAELSVMMAGWRAPFEISVSLQRERYTMRIRALLTRPGSDSVLDSFGQDVDVRTPKWASSMARAVAIKFAG